MPKTVKAARTNAGKVVFTPKAEAKKETEVNGKKMAIATARAGGKGSMRMKGKVVRKGAAADMMKLEAAKKTLRTQQLGGMDECEMMQKYDGKIKITTWKSPKLESTIDGGVFFVSGASKAEEMTEAEFDAKIKAQFEEMTKGFTQPAEEEAKPEEEKKEEEKTEEKPEEEKKD